eukprot:COSAG02_NODE_54312_length_296_cov_2.898477_1_plen_83_part_01
MSVADSLEATDGQSALTRCGDVCSYGWLRRRGQQHRLRCGDVLHYGWLWRRKAATLTQTSAPRASKGTSALCLPHSYCTPLGT